MKRTFRESLTRSIRGVAKNLLPEAALREAGQFLSYETQERLIYLKMRALDGLGLTPRNKRPPKTARKFLFVCWGNIIRSPMCEALMNRELVRLGNAQFSACSAGLNATSGRPAHPWAIAAALEFGVSLEEHRARRLSEEDLDQADAIFAMDYQNRVQLLTRWSSVRNKVFMLSAYADKEYRSVEIPDPYYRPEEQTRFCYQVLNTCIQNLVRSLPCCVPQPARPFASISH